MTDQDRLAAYDEALVSLTQELSYLVLLGWVTAPVPDDARSMPAAIGIQRMDPNDMVEALRYLDGQRGPAALQRLRSLGETIPSQVDLVLSPNVRTDSATHPSIGANAYLQAYDLLLTPWSQLTDTGSVSSIVPPRSETSSATTAPAAAAADTTPAPASSGSTGSGSSTVVLMVLAIALIAIAGAVGVVVRARRRPGARDGSVGDDVLDAGRTIMAAVDLDGFGRAVADQVARLVGAPGAVVVDGRTFVPDGRPMPDAAVLTRAMSTGREVRANGTTVVPVVADGRVMGALVAWTERAEAAGVLGVFAPLVGAALQGVRTRLEHEHLAFDDGLTGVGNRRRFDRDLDGLLDRAGRDRPVALAMVDIDHFKRVNDTHGHPVGDAVLRHVATVIAANVREGDLVYRYGGEEFAVLLPGAELDEALRVVERVRAAVAVTPLVGEAYAAVPPVTVSVGVSATPPVDASAMVRLADGALYAAKSGGRNRVETGAPA
ncbi:MAG: GGDEF domain-containing protein [Acidimicrobiales bacterium]